MSLKELQQEILRSGLEHNMCDKFRERLEAETLSRDELCGLFHAGLDFCIEHDWPSIEFIENNFHPHVLHRNGIYTHDDCVSKKQKSVIAMGDCVLDVYVEDGGMCDIYVRHSATINIHAGMGSFVYISCLDNGTVNILESDGAKINASYFSGTINNKEKFNKIHIK